MIKQQERRSVDVEDAGGRFGELVEAVSRDGERVLVARDGRTVAALVSARDLALIERADRVRDRRSALLERLRAPFRDVPPAEIEREVATALAEVRAEVGTTRKQAVGITE